MIPGSLSDEAVRPTSDFDLVQAARNGDMAAFRAIYERHRERVGALVAYLLRDPIAAEDALQAVFLKVYQGLSEFRFEAAVETWILRIAVNECRDRQRRRANDFVPLEDIVGSALDIDPEPLPDEVHARRRTREAVREAVLMLSPKLRAVVVLKYLHGLSYDEIAAVLGCSTGTVASRLNRALTDLESRLRPLKHLL